MSPLNVIAEPNTHEILVIREFDASPELVFKAFIDPTLIPRWWGMGETVVDKLEPKTGGVWRYVQHDPAGGEYAFNGVFHTVTSPERLVFTFEFEGMPGHVLLETVTFEARDGKTVLRDSSVFQSVADRDGMLQSGFEGGTTISWNRLDELLKTMA
jgi:uncharacterized protein YndB with AHSA1/START domain